MKTVANDIRDGVKKAGFNRNDVSVKCLASYQIKVINKSGKINNDTLLSIVETAYYKKTHTWLIVWVNAYCLPMEKKHER